MPKSYERNCDKCGKYYNGFGKKFCSYLCSLKGRKFTEEHKKKLSEAHLGKRHEAWNKNRKMNDYPQCGYKNGHKSYLTENSKIKIGLAVRKRYDIIGRKLHSRSYHIANSKEYKQWRISVFIRDNFTCQNCQIRGVYLEAHHIKSWAHYPELRYDVENGVTLCRGCHKLTRKRIF